MKQLDVAFALVGLIVLTLAFLSGPIRRLSVFSRPLVAVLIGILVGPHALRLLDPAQWPAAEQILEKFALVTIGIAIMGVALRLPAKYIKHHRRSLLVLLLVVMPLMTAVSAGLIGLALALPAAVTLLIAAVVTPTDPIVAGTIVAGEFAEKNLPEHLRHIVSAETGANDGLVYPVVLLPLLLIGAEVSLWWTWLGRGVGWGIGGGALLGWIVGSVVGRSLLFAEAKKMIGRASLFAYSLALTLLTLGLGELLSVSSIFAVFIAGIAFDDHVRVREREQEEIVQEAVNQFFTVPIFALLGVVIPWQGWFELGWRGFACAVAIVALRRVPAVMALHRLIPDLRNRSDALFAAWFGPIGIAAFYYALIARRTTGIEQVWTVTTLVIALSIVAHGVTAVPFTRLHARAARGTD